MAKYKITKSNPLLPVHMTEGESKLFDQVQGEILESFGYKPEPLFDPKTGLRMYPVLGEIFNLPPLRKLFLNSLKVFEDPNSHKAKVLSKISQKNPLPSLKFKKEPASEEPIVKAIESLGIDGDNDLVLLPLNVINVFDEALGDPRNPKTGLPQYKKFWKRVRNFFKKAVRVVATVAGSVAGGPIGGALAGSASGALLGKNKRKSALTGALYGAGTGLGIQAFPGIGQGLSSMLAGNISGGLGQIGSSVGEGISQAGSSLSNMFSGSSNGSSSLLPSGLTGKLGMAALAGAVPLYMRGHKKERKDVQDEQDRQERERLERAQNLKSLYDKSGYGEGLNTPEPTAIQHLNPNIDWDDPEIYRTGTSQRLFTYKKGGYVKGDPIRHVPMSSHPFIEGHEKGQVDNVYTQVPAGTFITDSSLTSDAGDGNTEAGKLEIQKFIRKHSNPKYYHLDHNSPPVKVALSAGEGKIPPSVVANIGNGNINEGAKRLDRMVSRLRRHKASNGGKLPPAAYSLDRYLRG